MSYITPTGDVNFFERRVMYVCDYTYKPKAQILLFDIVPEECASKAYISKYQQDLTSVEGMLCRMEGAEQLRISKKYWFQMCY